MRCLVSAANRLFLLGRVVTIIALAAAGFAARHGLAADPPRVRDSATAEAATPGKRVSAPAVLSVQLLLDKTVIKPDDFLSARLLLHNYGKTTVRVLQPHGLNPSAKLVVDLRDAKTGQVAKGGYSTGCDMTNPLVASDFLTLAPGKTTDLYVPQDYFRGYQLTPGHRYRLTVTYVSDSTLSPNTNPKARGNGLWADYPKLIDEYRATTPCKLASKPITIIVQ